MLTLSVRWSWWWNLNRISCRRCWWAAFMVRRVTGRWCVRRREGTRWTLIETVRRGWWSIIVCLHRKQSRDEERQKKERVFEASVLVKISSVTTKPKADKYPRKLKDHGRHFCVQMSCLRDGLTQRSCHRTRTRRQRHSTWALYWV